MCNEKISMKISKDDRVRHPQFGEGRVRMVDEDTAIVRFESGRMEECLLKAKMPSGQIPSNTYFSQKASKLMLIQ